MAGSGILTTLRIAANAGWGIAPCQRASFVSLSVQEQIMGPDFGAYAPLF